MTSLAYLNTRLKGRQAHFFQENIYNSLLSNFNFSVFIDTLLESSYSKNFHKNTNASTLDQIIECISTFCQQEMTDIFRITDEKTGELLKLFLCKWDLVNIKSIFSAKISGKSQIKFQTTGLLSHKDCELLSKEHFSESSVFLRNHSVAFLQNIAPLARTLESKRNIRQFCRDLDQLYYSSLFSQPEFQEEELRNVFSIDLDRRNIMEALLHVALKNQESYQPLGWYGTISKGTLNQIVQCEKVETAMEPLLGTAYRKALMNGILLYERTGELNFIERIIETQFFTRIHQLCRIFPLSISVPLYYICRLINQTTNLIMIALGIEYNTVPNLIRRKLIIA